MSSSPDWSENFLVLHITCDYCWVIMEVGLSGLVRAQYNQEVRFSSGVKCKKGLQVLTSCLIKDEIIIIIDWASEVSDSTR